jgi:hypothetical protein
MSEKHIHIKKPADPTPPNPIKANAASAAPQTPPNPAPSSATPLKGAPDRPLGIGRWNNTRDTVPKLPWTQRLFRMRLPIVVIGCAIGGAQAVYYYLDPMGVRWRLTNLSFAFCVCAFSRAVRVIRFLSRYYLAM